MVLKEIRESQVIQKVHGQGPQDQRESQDCQVTKERKEKEDYLVYLDSQGLLELREPLGILEVLAPQESGVLMATWGLKE